MKNKFDVKTKDQYIMLKKEILDNIKEIKKRERLLNKNFSLKKLKDGESEKLLAKEEKRYKKEFIIILNDYNRAIRHGIRLNTNALKNSIEVDEKFEDELSKLAFSCLDKFRVRYLGK